MIETLYSSIITWIGIVLESKASNDRRNNPLGFGILFGQALKEYLAFEWSHDECASVGMVLESELACGLGYCSPDTVLHLKDGLRKFKLPVAFDAKTKEGFYFIDVGQIIKRTIRNQGNQQKMVLLKSIGETIEFKLEDLPEDIFDAVLVKLLCASPSTDSEGSSTKEDQHTLSTPFTLKLVSAFPHLDHLVLTLSEELKAKVDCTFLNYFQGAKSIGNSNDIYIFFSGYPCSVSYSYSLWFEFIIVDPVNFINDAMTFVMDKVCGEKIRHVDPLNSNGSYLYHMCVSGCKSITSMNTNDIQEYLKHADVVQFRANFPCSFCTNIEWKQNHTGMQLANLRGKTKLPIIFTLRNYQEPDLSPQSVDLYMRLLEWAHRWGCEYIEVELKIFNRSNPTAQAKLLKLNKEYSKTCKLMISHYSFTPSECS